MTCVCATCKDAPLFPGWDDCLKCGTAVEIQTNPGYLAWASKTYAHDPSWVAQVTAEWNRQLDAIAHVARSAA